VREYEYFLTLLVAAAVTYLLTPLVRKLAIKIGAAPPARDRDVHAAPIPRMGGVAIYFGIAAGLLAANELVPFRDVIRGTGLVNGLLLAGGLIVIIGVIDDRWGISAIGKLAGQVAAAGVLVASGAQLSSFPLPQGHVFGLTQNEGVVLTILLVVATINAVNFIDGLDGLAAGIVCIAAISFFIYYYSLTKVANGPYALPIEAVPALASVVLAGACLGFLPHNFHPARIFMGDTGSMLLGLMLAYVPISAISTLDFQSLADRANRYAEILPLLLPAAVLVIPYTDMMRAVIRRTRAGLSPFAPDRQHLHHRMLDIGHSHRSSVLIMYAWAALFASLVVGLSIATAPLIVLAGTTLAAILVLVLLSIPRLRWWQRGRTSAGSHAAQPATAPAGGPAIASTGGQATASAANPTVASAGGLASAPVTSAAVAGPAVAGPAVAGRSGAGPSGAGPVTGPGVFAAPIPSDPRPDQLGAERPARPGPGEITVEDFGAAAPASPDDDVRASYRQPSLGRPLMPRGFTDHQSGFGVDPTSHPSDPGLGRAPYLDGLGLDRASSPSTSGVDRAPSPSTSGVDRAPSPSGPGVSRAPQPSGPSAGRAARPGGPGVGSTSQPSGPGISDPVDATTPIPVTRASGSIIP
jgi:UDP-GlcNAc:undecaprenyl-phosphate/decaprenyl-phosphate GlcNAc-1-phosphate transferase